MKAFIFDMDGTIVDNMQFHLLARIILLHKYGIFISLEKSQPLRDCSFSSVIRKYFKKQVSDEEIKALNEEKQIIYRMLYENYIKEVKGLRLFLQSAKVNGYSTALATMGGEENIDFVLRKLNIRQLFDVIVSGDKVKRGKPYPDIYNSALSALNIRATDAVAFEDSLTGVLSAKEAGLKVCGICTSHSRKQFSDWGIENCICSYGEVLEMQFLKPSLN